MPPILRREGDALELDLSEARGYEFQDALDKIKAVTGRRYDGARKIWSVPAEPDKAEQIINLIRPQVDDEIRRWVVESKIQAEADLLTPLPDDSDVLVPWGFDRCAWQPVKVNDEKFVGLLDYQRSAVAHLVQQRRAILADDMGLGKTLESISTVEEYRLRALNSDGTAPDGPRLVVTPASVMGGWVRELERWLEPGTFDVQLVDGYNAKKRHQQVIYGIKNNAWVIVNWEQLVVERVGYKVKHQGGATSTKYTWVMKEPLLEVPHIAWMEPSLDDLDFKVVRNARKMPDAHGWLAVIADEAHKAKNRKAKRSKGLHRIAGDLMLALTGTPIMNSPDEIWSLLHWLWPEQYTSFEAFFGEYVDFYENEYLGSKVITGVKNPDALRFELKGRLVRRTQGQVRKSLPGRRRIYFPVNLLPEQQKLYDEAESAIWLEVQQAAAEGDESAAKLKAAAESGDAVPASLYRIPNGAARLVRLRQIIETPANLGGSIESALIDDFIEKVEDSEPEPWLAFTEFKPTCEVVADKLCKKFGFDRWTRDGNAKRPTVAIYTGDTPKDERTMIEDGFQNGSVRVIIGTIGALQVGITLTAGHLQYWFSRSWVPAINDQGEGRQADRLGQRRTTITYIPEAVATVAETKVPVILDRKEAITRVVISKDKIEEVHHA